MIIAFGWTRHYYRRVKFLYERSVFVPSRNEEGDGLELPPTEEFPGEWETTPASTTYAEYLDKGLLEQSGPAFVEDEAARYTADDHPTTDDAGETIALETGYRDLAYQGMPAPEQVSTWPRWTLKGTATGGGSFSLQDANSLRWMSGTPLIVHEFEIDDGSPSGSSCETKQSVSLAVARPLDR